MKAERRTQFSRKEPPLERTHMVQNDISSIPEAGITFLQLAEQWLGSIRGSVKESSFTRYHRTVHTYLVSAFGEDRITSINCTMVNCFKEEMRTTGGKRSSGLSEKTVTDILSTFKLIVRYGEEMGYTTLPTALIHNPRRRKKEITVLPQEMMVQLEQALLCSNRAVDRGILLVLHTGLRNGELCGLRWEDFDFSAHTVHIARTVERIANLDEKAQTKTKIIISEPKTESSTREIPIPRTLSDYLRPHAKESAVYLLTGKDHPMEPHTLYVHYQRFLTQNGFPHYTFHALRHTFATRGIASGFDMKSLSEILGHSDVTTTLRCYIHPSMEEKRRQMEALFGDISRTPQYER